MKTQSHLAQNKKNKNRAKNQEENAVEGCYLLWSTITTTDYVVTFDLFCRIWKLLLSHFGSDFFSFTIFWSRMSLSPKHKTKTRILCCSIETLEDSHFSAGKLQEKSMFLALIKLDRFFIMIISWLDHDKKIHFNPETNLSLSSKNHGFCQNFFCMVFSRWKPLST